MKRNSVRIALICCSLLVVISVIACSGGGSTQSGPVPGPANVAVTSGYHSAHLTWNTVSGASFYKVYAAATSNASPSTLSPVSVASAPFDEVNLPPWVPVYYRVSAVITSAETALSVPVMALPNDGFLIASQLNPGQKALNVYESDVNGAPPLLSITSGEVIGPAAGAGLLYGVGCQAGWCSEVGIFATGTNRVRLANQPGHSYQFAPGYQANGRLIVEDSTGGMAPFALLSSGLDGSGMATLKAGCGALSQVVLNAKGLLFNCDAKIYASDGNGPAVTLKTSLGDTPVATDGKSALLMSGNRLTSQPADGTGSETQFTGNLGYCPVTGGSADTFLGAADSTALVLTQIAGATPTYDTTIVAFDGSTCHSAGNAGAAAPTILQGVTADHSHFLVRMPGSAAGTHNAFLIAVHGGLALGLSPLNPSTTDNLDARLLEDGNVVLQDIGQTKWQVIVVGTANFQNGVLVGKSLSDVFCGNTGKYVIFKSGPGTQPLVSYVDDSSTSATLSGAADCIGAPLPSPLPAGRVPFVDAGHVAWVAAPDGSFNVRLEASSSDGIAWSGNGPGTRDSYILHHPAGDYDTVVFDTVAHTADPILPASRQGYLSP